MTYRPRATCLRCGVSRQAVGHLSRRGLCLDCGITAEAGNIAQLRGKAGPYYDHWRDSIVAAVASLPGVLVIPDTLPDVTKQEARPLAGQATAGG